MRIRSFADKDQDGIVFTAVLDTGGNGVFVSGGLNIETVADTNGPFSEVVGPAIDATGLIALRGILDTGEDFPPREAAA